MPRTSEPIRVARRVEAKALGRRLAEARQQAGLTQIGAARALGMPQSAIAKLELGLRQLRFTEGLRLAELYEVDPRTWA